MRKNKIFLCEACGIVSRGKLILKKLEQSYDFSCAMGNQSKFCITIQVSFYHCTCHIHDFGHMLSDRSP